MRKASSRLRAAAMRRGAIVRSPSERGIVRGASWIAGLFVALTPAAWASDAIGPHIYMRIEQPVYAGLPVWLDVDAHAACPDWHIYRGIVLGPTDGPDIIGPDGASAAFTPASNPLRARSFAPRSACPDDSATTPAGTIRIPLHLAASIRKPGDYQVRWAVRSPDNTSLIAISPWLHFTVSPSTAAQRETWLQHVLAQQPSSQEAALHDYVPSLLAAYDDPRVIRRVMDLTCTLDETPGAMLGTDVAYALDTDTRDYAVLLVKHGCLTRGLIDFLSQHGVPDGIVRKAFTDMALRHLGTSISADAMHAIEVLIWANRNRSDALARRANTAILRFEPHIATSSDFRAKVTLITYAEENAELPDRHALLRRFAMQRDRSSEMAMDALVELRDPADLPIVAARLSGPLDGLVMGNLTGCVWSLGAQYHDSPAFTAAAQKALHTIMAHAQVTGLRDTAALVAANMNDAAGILAVLHVLHDGTPRQAATVLDGTNMAELGIACPVERASCTKPVAGAPDPNAPWIAKRKAAVTAYYQAKLKY